MVGTEMEDRKTESNMEDVWFWEGELREIANWLSGGRGGGGVFEENQWHEMRVVE